MVRENWSRETVVTPWGFRMLAEVPEQAELAEYYAKRYYQENPWGYHQHYDDLETRYTEMITDRKVSLLRRFVPELPRVGRYLDVGCGEGHSLDYFLRAGWTVKGLDFSIAGVRNHHPELEQYVDAGDLFDLLDEVLSREETYDVVWLDNVLEHVREPLALLVGCRRILARGGAIVAEVPNDFSIVQADLAARGLIDEASWVFPPDHISYFSRDGLAALARSAGLVERGVATNVPIDWFLYHPASNYYADKSVGSDAHRARMMIELLISEQDREKVLNLAAALADLGMGREILSVLTADEPLSRP